MANSQIDTGQQEMVVEGYAIIFDTMSDDLGGFKEIINQIGRASCRERV